MRRGPRLHRLRRQLRTDNGEMRVGVRLARMLLEGAIRTNSMTE